MPANGPIGPDELPDEFHTFYRDLIPRVNTTVHRLATTAFCDASYRAFAFGGCPRTFCEE